MRVRLTASPGPALAGALADAGAGRRPSGYLTGEHARTDAVRTVPPAPGFADTKARALRAGRLVGSLQLEATGRVGAVGSRLVAGTDAWAGRVASPYAQVAREDLDA